MGFYTEEQVQQRVMSILEAVQQSATDRDDLCDACSNEPATRECAHGIVCEECDKQVHGGIGAPCEL